MGFRTIGQNVLEGAKNSHFEGALPGFIVGEGCTLQETGGHINTGKGGIFGWQSILWVKFGGSTGRVQEHSCVAEYCLGQVLEA